MTELGNGLERKKKYIYVSSDGLKENKIMYISYNGLEMYVSVCNKNICFSI